MPGTGRGTDAEKMGRTASLLLGHSQSSGGESQDPVCYREQKAGSPEQKGQHVQRIVDKRDPGPVRKCRQGIRAKILIFITLTPGSVCRNLRAQGVGGAQSSEGLSVKSLPASRNETQSRRLRTSPEAPSLKLGGPLPSETDTGKKSPGIQVTIQTARTSDPIGIGHHLVSEYSSLGGAPAHIVA